MLYSYKELKKILKSNYQIEKSVNDGKYYKIKKGLYSSEPNVNYLMIIKKKYPYAVIYGESAYYYYNLTDFVPKKIIVATSKNATIRSKDIKQVRMVDKLYDIGVTDIEIDNIIVKIYDKEKMLIELARNKRTMGYDMYKEIITNYRKIADEIDIEKLEDYLKYYTNGDSLFEIIQDEVF